MHQGLDAPGFGCVHQGLDAPGFGCTPGFGCVHQGLDAPGFGDPTDDPRRWRPRDQGGWAGPREEEGTHPVPTAIWKPAGVTPEGGGLGSGGGQVVVA